MKKFITISRPRFWVYVAGPFWLCTAIVYPTQMNLFSILFFLIYFTFPANILIYGINDIYDRATDSINTKKIVYEKTLDRRDDQKLIWVIILSNLPFLLYGFFFLPQMAMVSLVLFVVLAWQYSAPPLRAKAIPFVDSFVSGLLYLVPALVSWNILTQTQPSWEVFLAGFCWSYAMHMYSAIPDIDADTKAGIRTGATILGKNRALILCGILYALSAIIAYMYVGFIALVGGVMYLCLVAVSYQKKNPGDVLPVYALFPFLNTAIGAVIFFFLFFK